MERDDPTPRSSPPSQKLSETPAPLRSLSQSAAEGRDQASRSVRLRTAWPRLSRLCPPRSGRIWLVGGAPGAYKTQLALNLALDMATLKQRVLFVTLELTMGEIGMAALARASGVPLDRLDRAFGRERLELTAQEDESVAAAQERLAATELYLRVHGAERHGHSLDEILRSATRNRFDAVFVDHLGMVDRGGRGGELEAIPRAADALRRLCRGRVVSDYAPFVCVTTPLSRKRDEDEHPKLSHLRGSGNLEYDADVAVVVQKRAQPEESTAPDVVDGYVLKNRQARCPVVLQFEAHGATCHVTERHAPQAPPPDHWQERAEERDPGEGSP
jgi:replicative DNA helicase